MRDAYTVIPLIDEWLDQVSMVLLLCLCVSIRDYGDNRKAYNKILEMQFDFEHRYMNGKLWFVDGDNNRVHTQAIANTWRKRDLNHMRMTQPDF